MNKVVCIRKCTEYEGGKPFWVSPEVGEYCTVKGDRIKHGKKYLFFYEYEGFGYEATSFATLPDTPAEVIEEKETEYATA